MDFSRFYKLAKNSDWTVLSKNILSDCDTPISIYLKIANKTNTFLLESVQGGETWGRYSIIGLQSSVIFKATNQNIEIIEDNNVISKFQNLNPLKEVQKFIEKYKVAKDDSLPKFFGGLVGYFSYDIARYENHKLKQNLYDDIQIPDVLLMLCKDLILVDNLKNQTYFITIIDTRDKNNLEKLYNLNIEKLKNLQKQIEKPFSSSKPLYLNNQFSDDFILHNIKEKFKDKVLKIKEYIENGDLMQVVISQRFALDFDSNKSFDLYRALRYINPSPYMYYINFDNLKIVGSSPEVLVRFEDNLVTIRPIAGTRKRGSNESADLELEKDLLQDTKEIAEHIMLIDLARNDVAKVSKTGTVKLTKKMIIERYQTVMHIVSNVEGEVKDGLNAMQILKSALPAGTLSGAPKIRAMQIIDELEDVKRGIYGGAVGYLGFDGNLDTAIAIRTAIITNGKLFVQAGAGVVADSDPESEWEEVLNKRSSIMKALSMVY